MANTWCLQWNVIGLRERVAGTIERHNMLAHGQRVGVAVSGGADSVCLLHVLLELAPRWNWDLSVVHVNHRLRGAESEGDAAFVRELAARCNLPVQVCEAAVATAPGNLEQAAREARLAFFGELMAAGQVERVAVGHTRSDQAETVLFRFLRGSGSAGLAGIRPVTRAGIVRPLLEVERGEVEDYLRERGIPWRTDSSNASREFARNRIRHELLPQLEREWNPAVRDMLTQTADWAQAEEAWWGEEMARLAAVHLSQREGAVLARADALAGLPLAVGRRLVRHAMARARGSLRGVDFAHVTAVLELASRSAGSGRVRLPGLEVRRSFNWVRFVIPGREAPAYQREVAVPGTVELPGTKAYMSLELIEKSETSGLAEYVYNDDVSFLDWESVAGALVLRNWQAGDRYQPAGSSGEEKIKTLFQQARIPSWDRRQWPILVADDRIVWVWRFGPATGVAAGERTRTVLRIRENPEGVTDFGIGIGQDGV